MRGLKYLKEFYEKAKFYAPGEYMTNCKRKIGKVRKEHICYSCQKQIISGEHALIETCFIDKPHTSYTCITCCNKWINEIEDE